MSYTVIPVLPWREEGKPCKCLVRTILFWRNLITLGHFYNTVTICQMNHFLRSPMNNKIHTANSLIPSTCYYR